MRYNKMHNINTVNNKAQSKERRPLGEKLQANPLLSMNNDTPLVISRNDKNTQLPIISQC